MITASACPQGYPFPISKFQFSTYLELPFTTVASLCTEINDILRQSFLGFDLIQLFSRLNIAISPCTFVGKLLDTRCNSRHNPPRHFCLQLTTVCKPTHDLMTNLLQHCQNWHLSCHHQLCVESFHNIGRKVTVSLPFKVQICPVLRVRCLKEPVGTSRVDR